MLAESPEVMYWKFLDYNEGVWVSAQRPIHDCRATEADPSYHNLAAAQILKREAVTHNYQT